MAETTGVAGRDGGVAVLVKAFNVLEVMAELGDPVPLRQIARATALPKGTLFRILQTLCALGYVNQIAESNFYYLTSQITYLGRNARQEDLKLLALPLMRTLHAKFNETVNLGVLEGVFVYYVAVLEAQRPLAWRVPAGTRDMYYSTALGRAIVGHLRPEVTAAMIERTNLRARTSHTVGSRDQLAAILEATRAAGVAFDKEENDDGVVCIGVPLFLDGRVIAALSVSVPSTRYTDALGEELRQAMTGLDRQFRTMRGAAAPRLEPL